MRDYMKALHQQFNLPSRQAIHLEKKVHELHRKLSGKLAKPERKLLLLLMDLEDLLRDEACLNSFFSGYRLAHGVHAELAGQPPYDFEADQERRARGVAREDRYD